MLTNLSTTVANSEGDKYASPFISWSSFFQRSSWSSLWRRWRNPQNPLSSSGNQNRTPDVMCSKPYRQGVAEYGCGQCIPCRINRARLWTGRILLESQLHADNIFITLTYSEENLPVNGELNPKHVQLWLKRVRRSYPGRVRFFAVGEYGDQTKRPHYHVVLFGVSQIPLCVGSETRDGFLHIKSWPWGHVFIGALTPDSARYVAGYVVKKCTSADDPRLNGRHPEFARMSLNPGIGADAMEVIADVGVTSEAGVAALVATGDVPTSVRADGKLWSLGRYLRRKLRVASGLSSIGQTPVAERLSALQRIVELTEPGGREKIEIKREKHRLKARFQSKLTQRTL